MCFSAAASFGASIALTALGVASIRQVKEPSQFPFAGIPLIFGFQQFVEGVVWVSSTEVTLAGFQAPASYLFLVIAQVIWPILYPLAFLRLEKDINRKKILRLFVIPGIMTSAYFAYCLFTYSVETRIINHHVFYDLDFPFTLIPFAAGFYLTATVVPPLFSKDIRIKLIGIILIAGYLVARILFQPSLISVWCFFGVGVSILIYMILHKANRQQPHKITPA